MLYYRFKAVGIDVLDNSDVEKHSTPLQSADCLSEGFDRLKRAFDNRTKERADIIVNAVPAVAGILEIAVFHKIKFKPFSRAVKTNVFSLCITHIDYSDKMRLYYLETDDFTAVKEIFTDFTENGKAPALSDWKCKFIG